MLFLSANNFYSINLLLLCSFIKFHLIINRYHIGYKMTKYKSSWSIVVFFVSLNWSIVALQVYCKWKSAVSQASLDTAYFGLFVLLIALGCCIFVFFLEKRFSGASSAGFAFVLLQIEIPENRNGGFGF